MMKIGLLTDSHLCDKKTFTYRKVKKALQRMNDVDFIVFLGDLIDRCCTRTREKRNITRLTELFKQTGKEFYILAGNHDCMVFPKEHFARLVESPKPPYSLSREDILLIFLDANYNRDDIPYAANTNDWKNTKLPEFEVEWLRERLKNSQEKRVYVFLHQNIVNGKDANYVLANADEVKKILENDGRVHSVFQGHYHKGNFETENGIQYITPTAVASFRFPCYRIEIL